MKNHYCNKEEEISEIHKMVVAMNTKVAGMDTTVTALNKAIMGNGQKGLLQKFNEYEGARKLVTWLFGSSFIVSIGSLAVALLL